MSEKKDIRIIRCRICGTLNRVPKRSTRRKPICGKCKENLKIPNYYLNILSKALLIIINVIFIIISIDYLMNYNHFPYGYFETLLTQNLSHYQQLSHFIKTSYEYFYKSGIVFHLAYGIPLVLVLYKLKLIFSIIVITVITIAPIRLIYDLYDGSNLHYKMFENNILYTGGFKQINDAYYPYGNGNLYTDINLITKGTFSQYKFKGTGAVKIEELLFNGDIVLNLKDLHKNGFLHLKNIKSFNGIIISSNGLKAQVIVKHHKLTGYGDIYLAQSLKYNGKFIIDSSKINKPISLTDIIKGNGIIFGSNGTNFNAKINDGKIIGNGIYHLNEKNILSGNFNFSNIIIENELVDLSSIKKGMLETIYPSYKMNLKISNNNINGKINFNNGWEFYGYYKNNKWHYTNIKLVMKTILKWIKSSCKQFNMPTKYPNPCEFNYNVRLPKHVLRNKIYFKSGYEIKEHINKSAQFALGVYNPNNESIAIHPNSTVVNFIQTMGHELFHHLQHKNEIHSENLCDLKIEIPAQWVDELLLFEVQSNNEKFDFPESLSREEYKKNRLNYENMIKRNYKKEDWVYFIGTKEEIIRKIYENFVCLH